MGSVRYEIDIKAPPEKVFTIIEDVEAFPRYSSFIDEVRQTASGTYQWKVDLMGMRLDWEAEVTESVRPKRFAWRSVRGTFNRGSYTLEPTAEGTHVSFEMEYHLTDSILERIASPLASRLVSCIYGEFLENIRKELERNENKA